MANDKADVVKQLRYLADIVEQQDVSSVELTFERPDDDFERAINDLSRLYPQGVKITLAVDLPKLSMLDLGAALYNHLLPKKDS